MSQSSIIAFALLMGFVLYVTARGELPHYLYVLGLGGTPPAGNYSMSTGSSSGGGLNLGSILSDVQGISSGMNGTAPNMIGPGVTNMNSLPGGIS